MQSDIKPALFQILNTRLSDLGRAADLQWFTFVNAGAEDISVHVMCPWRMTRGAQILVGWNDYWRPASAHTPDESFEKGEVGARLRDVAIEFIRQQIPAGGLEVTRLDVDVFGGFKIDLKDDFSIAVFPEASSASHDEFENWRIFRKGKEHFVVTSDGCYLIDAEKDEEESNSSTQHEV